ncbi:MAG: HAMP domain-containing histidine kinase [Methylobacterium mesophilicum]|nr:HAMP domain-containing histidine kinase [Methylobacterium mesophilicum]
MKRPLSIRSRFLITSLVSVPLALALAALFMISLFASNLEKRLESELGGLIGMLAAAIRFEPDGRLAPPDGLMDRRFSTPYGGLYWQIEDGASGTELRSDSLWDFTLALPKATATGGTVRTYDLPGPDGTRLMLQERNVLVASPLGTRELRIVVAADRAPLDAASRGFALQIAPFIFGLAVLLTLASLIQLTFGLRPLSRLAAALDRIRERSGERLEGILPREFEPVEDALNRLLDSQGRALVRARTSAGDLAHGLKTPLTVLANDALTLRERGEEGIADEIEHLVRGMRAHMEHELARSRIASSAEMRQSDGDLSQVVGEIVRTLRRTAAGEQLTWEIELPPRLILPVDPHDLRELVGNVIENAAKWARKRVAVRWQGDGGKRILAVEDDGPGIDPDKIGTMTLRGIRHDEAVGGTGLGLSIVREICDVYSLSLMIENRQTSGLRVAISF